MGLERLGDGMYRKVFTKEDFRALGYSDTFFENPDGDRMEDLTSYVLEELADVFNVSITGSMWGCEFSLSPNGSVTVTVKSLSSEDMDKLDNSDMMLSELVSDTVSVYADGVGNDTCYIDLEGRYEFAYKFNDIEDVIALSRVSVFDEVLSSSLYHYRGSYVLLLNFGTALDLLSAFNYIESLDGYLVGIDVNGEEYTLTESDLMRALSEYDGPAEEDPMLLIDDYLSLCNSVLAEYGERDFTTSYVLREYGNMVLENDALDRLPSLLDVE